MLTELEKIETRRHCGYPAYGAGASGFSSWRVYQAYGQLEYRINNLSAGELVVLRRYLQTLLTLESAIPRVSENLDTNDAAIWSRNPNECRDREGLYDGWRIRLCAFLGLRAGPGLDTRIRSLIV